MGQAGRAPEAPVHELMDSIVDSIMDAHLDQSGSDEIRLGVSRCLLGEKVRYDGGHKLDRWVRDLLGRFVTFVPVCPEVECGMTVPREPMRLEGDPAAPRLVTHTTRRDLTDRMQDWGRARLDELAREGLCGYVFKAKSPSSGMERIKVYQDNGHPKPTGTGIWARMFMDRFPLLPCEDEGRLHDPRLRENFIERVFTTKRLRELLRSGAEPADLVAFHTRHKLLIRAHDEPGYRELGRIVARAGVRMDSHQRQELIRSYVDLLATTLKKLPTPRKHANVLMHALGYFKRTLTSDEKQEALELIEAFRTELVPLIVPVTLINHFTRKYDEPYLRDQHYLKPHPLELMLRNHV